MSAWIQDKEGFAAIALAETDNSKLNAPSLVSAETEKYFAEPVMKDPVGLKWEEFSIAYEKSDPSLSTLAEYFSNGTDTAPVSSVPAYCKKIMHSLSDSELDYSWNELIPCVTYTNITRRIHDDSYPKNLTDALAGYNVNGSDSSVLLGNRLAQVIGKAMHVNCQVLRCGIEREDKWGLEEDEKKELDELRAADEEGRLGDEHHQVLDQSMSESCQQLFVNNATLSFEATNQCQADICIRAKDLLTADPEIGGPGVFISYVIQLFIALVFMCYFFGKHVSRYAHRKCSHHSSVSASSTIFGRRDAHPAFTNALESFQKLQAWFSASLVVAACIRQATQTVSDTDHYLLLCVSLNGVVLIPLTLLIMHRLERRATWSTFYLSTSAFTMCAGFLFVAVLQRKNSLFSLHSLWLHSQWCSREAFFAIALPHFWAIRTFLHIVDVVPDAVFWLTLVVCTLVLVALFIMRLEVHTLAVKRHPHLAKAERVLKVLVTISYTAILVLMLILLVPFFAVVNWKNWGFGQIVALSVFMPVLYDYLSERFGKKLTPEEYEDNGRRKSIFHPHNLRSKPLTDIPDVPHVDFKDISLVDEKHLTDEKIV